VHLGVALGHEGQEGRLGLGGDAVVLVDDLDGGGDPAPPGDADVAGLFGADQFAGQGAAGGGGEGEVGGAGARGAACVGGPGDGGQGHEVGHGRLAASGGADEDQAARGHEGQERQQDEGGVAGRPRQLDVFAVAADGQGRFEGDIMEGGVDGLGGDPVV